MAEIAASLQAIPPPGVAIHPPSIATQPDTLSMKSGVSGRRSLITDQSGTELFSIEGERFSMSHRMHVTDSSSGQGLCTLRKENFSLKSVYYAETSEDGPRIFRIESKTSLGSEKFIISFQNAAGNGEEVVLDWKSPAFTSRGEVYLNGMLVALLERQRFRLKSEFAIHVAPGMDKLLAVCIMACVHDYRKTKSAASAGAGSAAAAGGGGGGGGGC